MDFVGLNGKGVELVRSEEQMVLIVEETERGNKTSELVVIVPW